MLTGSAAVLSLRARRRTNASSAGLSEAMPPQRRTPHAALSAVVA